MIEQKIKQILSDIKSDKSDDLIIQDMKAMSSLDYTDVFFAVSDEFRTKINQPLIRKILIDIEKKESPEHILKLIMDLHNEPDVDFIIFHPSMSESLREEMNRLSRKWLPGIQEESKRVAEERKCVAEERKRVSEEIKHVSEERKRVSEESKRVAKELEQSERILEDIRSKRAFVRQLNNMIEGEIEMYRNLNNQLC